MTRSEFSKQVRRDAFARAKGHCEDPECGVKLFHGEAEYHHAKEDFMDGEPTLENCTVLCGKCHLRRTRARRPVIDKTRRISDKRMGIKRKSSFANNRLLKKFDGTVVDRATGEPLSRRR